MSFSMAKWQIEARRHWLQKFAMPVVPLFKG